MNIKIFKWKINSNILFLLAIILFALVFTPNYPLKEGFTFFRNPITAFKEKFVDIEDMDGKNINADNIAHEEDQFEKNDDDYDDDDDSQDDDSQDDDSQDDDSQDDDDTL